MSTSVNRSRRSLRSAVLASPALLALAGFATSARAATLYWDTNGPTDGAGTTPNGAWDNAASNWNDQPDGGAAGVIGPWVTDSSAVFSAGSDAVGPYTVTVSGVQSASDIIVEEGPVSITGGEITLNNTAGIDVASGTSLSISSVISGGGGISKTNNGTLNLADGSTYTGSTRISGGTLNASIAGLGNAANTIEFNSNGVWDVNGAGTSTRDILLTGDGTINNASALTYTGIISGAGYLNKTGAGTLRMGTVQTQANTFTRGLTITGGVVEFAGENNATAGLPNPLGSAPGAAVPDYIVLNNGTLRNTKNDGSGSASFLLANRGVTLSGDGTFEVSNAASVLQYTGKITGSGRLYKTGPGVLNMNTNTNDFTGGVTISGGEFRFAGISAAPNALGSPGGGSIILDGGTLRNTNIGNGASFLQVARPIEITANGGTLAVNDCAGNPAGDWSSSNLANAAQSANYQGQVLAPNGGKLIKAGFGELRSQSGAGIWYNTSLEVQSGMFRANIAVAGADTSFGLVPTAFNPAAIFMNGVGTNRATGGAALGNSANINTDPNRGMTISANGATFITNAALTFNGVITGAGGITLNENGWNPTTTPTSSNVLILTGANTFGGNVKINDATLEVRGGSAIPDNAAVVVAGASTNVFPVELLARFTVTNSETIGSLSGGGGTYGTVSVAAGAVLTTGNNNSDTTWSGQMNGTSGSLVKIGNGTMTLQGFDLAVGGASGNVTINGGAIKFGDTNAGFSNTVPVTIGAAGTLDMNGILDTVGSVAGSGPINNGANLILTGNNAAPVTYTGNYTGTGALTKNGAGVQNLGGNNTFNGATIAAGTVGVKSSNALGKGNLDVQGTSLVKLDSTGTGTIAPRLQALTVATGAKIDLADGKLITTSATGTWNGTNYDGVTALVATGRAGNLWTGNGIVTSEPSAIGGNFHSIGVAKASDARPATATATALWAGQTITGTDTLVMYTYGGDANLDGKINVDDYIKIDSGIAAGLKGWSNGDFNYDGKVNIDDYTTVIDANIGNQTGVFFTAGGVAAGGMSGVSAVPEPASITVLGIGTAAMFARRRRRSSM